MLEHYSGYEMAQYLELSLNERINYKQAEIESLFKVAAVDWFLIKEADKLPKTVYRECQKLLGSDKCLR